MEHPLGMYQAIIRALDYCVAEFEAIKKTDFKTENGLSYQKSIVDLLHKDVGNIVEEYGNIHEMLTNFLKTNDSAMLMRIVHQHSKPIHQCLESYIAGMKDMKLRVLNEARFSELEMKEYDKEISFLETINKNLDSYIR